MNCLDRKANSLRMKSELSGPKKKETEMYEQWAASIKYMTWLPCVNRYTHDLAQWYTYLDLF